MGATQHTYGSQNIRTYSIVQLLLGNMGVAGGGINALRGTSNVQGSTDFALLGQYLPGYIKMTTDAHADQELGSAATPNTYLNRITPSATNPPDGMATTDPVNWWKNTPKYVENLLRAWWPGVDPAVSYKYLPKKKASDVNYTHVGLIEAIGRGDIEGLFVWGQNPAAGGLDSNGAREALGSPESKGSLLGGKIKHPCRRAYFRSSRGELNDDHLHPAKRGTTPGTLTFSRKQRWGVGGGRNRCAWMCLKTARGASPKG